MIKKLVEVQSKLKAPKSQTNNFGKYKYRNCEDILEAVKPLLKENELILSLSDTIEVYNEKVYIKATAKVTDDTGAFIETSAYAREDEPRNGMNFSQATGSASSYARKYALNGLFCIDDTKDADTYVGKSSNKPIYATDEQIEKIKELVSDIPAMLKYYKANDLQKLTYEQAEKLISRKITENNK